MPDLCEKANLFVLQSNLEVILVIIKTGDSSGIHETLTPYDMDALVEKVLTANSVV